jgi:hypothetical protein
VLYEEYLFLEFLEYGPCMMALGSAKVLQSFAGNP